MYIFLIRQHTQNSKDNFRKSRFCRKSAFIRQIICVYVSQFEHFLIDSKRIWKRKEKQCDEHAREWKKCQNHKYYSTIYSTIESLFDVNVANISIRKCIYLILHFTILVYLTIQYYISIGFSQKSTFFNN